MSAYMSDTPTPEEMTLPATIAIKEEVDICEGEANKYGDVYNGIALNTVKNEPILDIEEPTLHMNIPESNSTVQQQQINTNNSMLVMNAVLPENPKIRLKPASKLMACTNAVDPKRRFICPFENCTKAYGKSSHLRSHLTWHTGVKPFVCKEANCGRGFTRSDELNRHIRTHTGEKPFECMQCSKKFSRSDHLTKHLATHAKQVSITNAKQQPQQQQQQPQQQQPRQYANAPQERVQQQQQQLQTQQQQQLQQQQQQQQQASNHLQFSDGMHFMAALISGSDGLGESEMETNEVKLEHQPMKVKIEHTNRNENLVVPHPEHPHHQMHQQQLQRQYQENERNVPAHINESEEDIPRDLIVPLSSMTCPPSPVSRTHDPMDDQIMPEANAPLPLRHAGNPLEKFEKTLQDPVRPFRCSHCVKCFKRPDDLNRHVRTHTGEKPFVCGECSRRFVRGDHLKKHMRTHIKAR